MKPFRKAFETRSSIPSDFCNKSVLLYRNTSFWHSLDHYQVESLSGFRYFCRKSPNFQNLIRLDLIFLSRWVILHLAHLGYFTALIMAITPKIVIPHYYCLRIVDSNQEIFERVDLRRSLGEQLHPGWNFLNFKDSLAFWALGCLGRRWLVFRQQILPCIFYSYQCLLAYAGSYSSQMEIPSPPDSIRWLSDIIFHFGAQSFGIIQVKALYFRSYSLGQNLDFKSFANWREC